MTDIIVLDTSVLVAFARLEPGAEQIRRRLESGRRFMHAVNVAELLFTLPRRMPTRFTPKSALAWFSAAEIGVANTLDQDFLRLTAEIRLTERSLSIGDGMAIALASVLGVPIITTERNFQRAGEYADIELIR